VPWRHEFFLLGLNKVQLGHSSLQVTMDRYGHLFRSDEHGRAMDAIADAIDSPVKARPPKNAHRKWSDFVP
jgi:hypothetical protein